MGILKTAALAAILLPARGAAEIRSPAVLWERSLAGEVRGSALAGGAVLVLAAESAGWRLQAYRPLSGKLAWETAAPEGSFLGRTPAGLGLLTTRDGLRALDPATGRERWRFERPMDPTNERDAARGGFASPAAADGRCVYAADRAAGRGDGGEGGPSALYCLDPATGKRLWSATMASGASGPSVAFDEDTVVEVWEGGATAVSKRDGTRLWSMRADTARIPAAVGAGAAFLPASGLMAVSLRDGAQLWVRQTAPMPFGPALRGGALYAPLPQLGPDVAAPARELTAYVRSHPRYVPTFVAMEPATGKELWERAFPGELRAGTLTRESAYLACSDGNLYRLDLRDGSVLWKQALGFGDSASAPMIWKDRLILAFGRRLVAVGEAK